MENVLDILIIEDDEKLCSELKYQITSSSDFGLAGICNNVADALELIQNHPPNIIILDLELHDGFGSGIEVLQALNNTSLLYSPFIIICTNNCSSYIHELTRNLGADYIFPKYQRDFSAAAVISYLSLMKLAIISKCTFTKSFSGNISQDTESYIKSLIVSKLDCIGINRKHKGYNLLLNAIYISLTQPDENYFQILSKNLHQKENSILQAMNRAIASTWKTQDIDTLLTQYTAFFNVVKGNPTPYEFISYYRDIIKKNIQNMQRIPN